jgi:hypothetical protein
MLNLARPREDGGASARAPAVARFGAIIISRGDVAQLGERRVRNAKVEGSIPFVSTNELGGLGLRLTLFYLQRERPANTNQWPSPDRAFKGEPTAEGPRYRSSS